MASKLDEFYDYVLGRGSEKTAKLYLCLVKKYFDYCKDEPTKDTFRNFIRELEVSGKSPQTVRTYYSAIRYYFQYFKDTPELCPKAKLPAISHAQKEALTTDEVKKLLDRCISAKERLMIYLLYDIALRAGELVRVQIEDFTVKSGFLAVHSEKKRGKAEIIDLVPIDDSLVDMVGEYIDSTGTLTGPLFPNLTYRSLLNLVRRLCRKAGIPRVGTHAFRHARGSQFASTEGINPYAVRDFMRHSSITTTDIYTKLRSDEVKRLIPPSAILPKKGHPEVEKNG